MKKIFFTILCAALLITLAACSGQEAAEETPEVSADVELVPLEPVLSQEEEEASAADAAALAAQEAPASATDAALDEDAYEAAQACVGLTAEELFAAVGEPSETSYAASCLEEGAEDGMLFYEAQGFYVWTVKGESGEVVHAVYPLD